MPRFNGRVLFSFDGDAALTLGQGRGAIEPRICWTDGEIWQKPT